MKFFVKIVICFFVLFQFSSVIICLINEKNESAIAYNINEEEEQQKNTEQFKAEVIFERNIYNQFVPEKTNSIFFDFYLLKEYSSILQSIYFPPESFFEIL